MELGWFSSWSVSIINYQRLIAQAYDIYLHIEHMTFLSVQCVVGNMHNRRCLHYLFNQNAINCLIGSKSTLNSKWIRWIQITVKFFIVLTDPRSVILSQFTVFGEFLCRAKFANFREFSSIRWVSKTLIYSICLVWSRKNISRTEQHLQRLKNLTRGRKPSFKVIMVKILLIDFIDFNGI